jgi:putative ABC transport system permease protein
MLWEHPPSYARNRVSPLNFLDWSEQNHAFTAMAAVAGGGRTLTGADGAAERVPGQAVTTAFFDVLGVPPMAGRTFVPGDATPKPNVVIVSERFWRSHLDGSATAVGRVLRLDGEPSPSSASCGELPDSLPSDLWTPFRRGGRRAAPALPPGDCRLRPEPRSTGGRSMALVAGASRGSPDTNKGWTVAIDPLRTPWSAARCARHRRAGVVAFVLMACANVANLLLAGGSAGRAKWQVPRRAGRQSRADAGCSCARAWCSPRPAAAPAWRCRGRRCALRRR